MSLDGLANVRTAVHVAQSFAELFGRKHLVHDWSEFVKNRAPFMVSNIARLPTKMPRTHTSFMSIGSGSTDPPPNRIPIKLMRTSKLPCNSKAFMVAFERFNWEEDAERQSAWREHFLEAVGLTHTGCLVCRQHNLSPTENPKFRNHLGP